MKFPAQQKANTGAAGRQQLVSSELVHARRHGADSAKSHPTQPPENSEPILQLCSKHVAVQVAPGLITAQLIVQPVDAVGIERWLASGAVKKNRL